MSVLNPCSGCGSREPGKLSSVTWAWWDASNKRQAWRQKLCLACYVSGPLILHQAVQDNPLDCPVCHVDPDDTMDPCYMTAFVPGIGRVRLEMATCTTCAVQVRERALFGAIKLDDSTSFGGQAPGPQTDPQLEAWKALGIEPRD